MINKILICWLGRTDLDASEGKPGVGLGPIASAAATSVYDEIVLLNNWDKSGAEHFTQWLKEQSKAVITLLHQVISGPTDFGEIYKVASSVVSSKIKEHGANIDLTFHLSPGTPAMAAVWIILAKTRFPAELIESSRQHGVKTVSIPFDISADFIEDLLKKPDNKIEKLAAGLPAEAPEFDDIIHRSESMRRVIVMARKVAPRSIPVLIEGESGTGKELLAHAVHDASPRRSKPFVAINCGAIPPELVESELFGHEKGAFTGAIATQIGHFEAAHTGTIFLDEIGELPKEIQVKLLRTLQEGEVKRIGSTTPRKIDVRIIAATNRNLLNEVAAGAFREDLFYRLAVAVINLPPLCERTGDISLLIDQFLARINQESAGEPGWKNKKISAPARNLLLRHSWPGNIRELQNTLTRAAVWSADDKLDEEDIRQALLPVPTTGIGKDTILNQSLDHGINLPEIMKTVAVHYLERGLAEAHGNKTKAAKILGLPSYQTLTNWLDKYDIE